MMSRIIRTSVVCVLVTFGISAFAQLKIAALSATTAILETEDGKAKQEEWQKEYQPEIDRLRALQEEINGLSERYRTDIDIMTETEKTALELDINSKSTRLTNGEQQLNSDRASKVQLYIREQAPLFQAVLTDLIAVEGYDAIFRLDTQEPIFLHLNEKHNITKKVIEKLNERMEEELPEELTENENESEEGDADESSEGGE
ncbi:MAG: OmpH family outer membrane protein [Gammaproteobacteria bacterium]|nr:OmpH family outer membrane protein [Gammaproteobacteria bacterium]